MLQVNGLTRRYGEIVALDDVSFGVPDGAMVGFVGGNGAGKTTAMRIIMGVLAPDEGRVTWQGRPVTAAGRARFGYMPEERGLYPKQKVLDQLTYLGQLHGMNRPDAEEAVTGLLERFGLGERTTDKVETLSLGNQQRAQIIASVLGEPVALILDEPFSGLDPPAVDQMAQLLREHTARGVPVLFSSHQLDLVERLCDSIVVLHQGKVVADGTAEQLRSSAPLRYRLTMAEDASWVGGVNGLRVIDQDGSSVLFEPRDEELAEHLLTEAVSRGRVKEFARVVPTLSEVYREVAA